MMTFVRTVGSTLILSAVAVSSSPLHSSSSCSCSSNKSLFNKLTFEPLCFPLNSIHTPKRSFGLPLNSFGNPSSLSIEMEQTPSTQTGRKAGLIGQGVPVDFLASSAVAEFKGPAIFGVVRLTQVDTEFARIEANFGGLSPGKHGWSIHEFGDVTKGAASTGKVFNPTNYAKEPLGDLETLVVDDKGDAFFSGVKRELIVADLIGRSIVVYRTEDRSERGVVAAVIARSAGVGENYNKLCGCDGTAIWEANSEVSCPRLSAM